VAKQDARWTIAARVRLGVWLHDRGNGRWVRDTFPPHAGRAGRGGRGGDHDWIVARCPAPRKL